MKERGREGGGERGEEEEGTVIPHLPSLGMGLTYTHTHTLRLCNGTTGRLVANTESHSSRPSSSFITRS